jgi:hypothetical protein
MRVIDALAAKADRARHGACLAYARRLREAGFTEEQAEGQAQALAAAMTDTLATKQDLHEVKTELEQAVRDLETRMNARFVQVDARFEYLEKHLDLRLAEQEKRMEIRFGEQAARVDGRLADLERRMTVRLLAGIAVISTLVELL